MNSFDLIKLSIRLFGIFGIVNKKEFVNNLKLTNAELIELLTERQSSVLDNEEFRERNIQLLARVDKVAIRESARARFNESVAGSLSPTVSPQMGDTDVHTIGGFAPLQSSASFAGVPPEVTPDVKKPRKPRKIQPKNKRKS